MGRFRNSFVARPKYHSLLSEHEHMLIINIFDFYDEIINQMDSQLRGSGNLMYSKYAMT